MERKTQQTSAAMAGMSVRSAWQCGPLPSETGQERWWRTRTDPFDGVWEEEILPLLQGEAAGRLRATTIIEWLEEKFPGRFSASQLRTMQRRLQDWRALNGPDQEVYFPQEHPPGREAQIDFTHCNSLGVTIRRPALPAPAVPAGAEPLGLAVRGGGCRADLPGPEGGERTHFSETKRANLEVETIKVPKPSSWKPESRSALHESVLAKGKKGREPDSQ